MSVTNESGSDKAVFDAEYSEIDELIQGIPIEELRTLLKNHRKQMKAISTGEISVIPAQELQYHRGAVLERVRDGERLVVQRKSERMAVLVPYAGNSGGTAAGLSQEEKDKLALTRSFSFKELELGLRKMKLVEPYSLETLSELPETFEKLRLLRRKIRAFFRLTETFSSL